jgi:hypothetical protein
LEESRFLWNLAAFSNLCLTATSAKPTDLQHLPLELVIFLRMEFGKAQLGVGLAPVGISLFVLLVDTLALLECQPSQASTNLQVSQKYFTA